MIEFSKILNDKRSGGFISFLIGMGVVILMFHKPFVSKQFLSIPVSAIEGKVVKHGDKCYLYKSEDVKCFNDKI